MRTALFIALLFPVAAMAQLYRWVEPQTGKPKFSSVPPPWYGDAEREAVSPRVEVIRGPAAPRPPAPAPEREAPKK